METRKKKKVNYTENFNEDEIFVAKCSTSASKSRKRKNESTSHMPKTSKSAKKELVHNDRFNVGHNWEQIVIKEEITKCDSDDDIKSENEFEMRDPTAIVEASYEQPKFKRDFSKDFYFTPDMSLPFDINLPKEFKVGDKCNFINFMDGYLKILLNGHIYFCNRVVDNIFYWQCDENKDCISQAVTMLNDEKHSIKSIDEHSHSSTVNGTCCLKDETIIKFMPNGFKQSSVEKGEVVSDILLVRNGYFYLRRKTEEDIDFWLCERFKSEGCRGALLTVKLEEEYYVKYSSEHNHLNDLERQYKCHLNESELEKMLTAMADNEEVPKPAADEEESISGDDTVDFDNDDSNDDPDFEAESDEEKPEKKSKKVKIKKEVTSEEEDFDEDEDDDEGENLIDSKDGVKNIECEIITARRRKPKLCVNGYMYRLNKKHKSFFWTCDLRQKIDCKATVRSIEGEDGKHIIQKMTEHSHPPTKNQDVVQVLNRIRDKCVENFELSAREIVENETKDLPIALRKSLPSKRAIYRMISRKRCGQETDMGGGKIFQRKEMKKLRADIETSIEVTEPTVCQVMQAVRGPNKLIYNDFLFNLHRFVGHEYFWRCEQRLSGKCVGFALTHLQDGVHHLKNIREHNHEPQRNRKYIAQVMNQLKEGALKTDKDLAVIVEEALRDLDDDVLRELPTKENLIRKGNRMRFLYKPKPTIDDGMDDKEDHSHIYEVGFEVGSVCDVFSPTNKGNFKLNLNGYYFHKNRINNGQHYWQCEDNKFLKCKGFAVTVCGDDGQHILKKARKHNHPAKESRQDIQEIIQRIKEKAKTSEEDSTLIYNDEIEHLPDEIKSLLPQRYSILSMINRIRKQNSDGDEKKEPIKYDDEHEHIFEIKQQPDTECEFVESKRGFEKLTIEGYLYNKEAYLNGMQGWMCNEKKYGAYSTCRGYAQTYEKDGKHLLKRTRNHNHPPNLKIVEMCRLMTRMRERVANELTHCAQIYDEETVNVSSEVFEYLPRKESIVHSLYNYRRRVLEAQGKKLENDAKTEGIEISPFAGTSTIKLPDDHIHETFVELGSEVPTFFNKNGTLKLNLNGFLLDKKNRNKDCQYWICQRKVSGECLSNAITIMKNGKHFLKSSRPHNHVADNSGPEDGAFLLEEKKVKKFKSRSKTLLKPPQEPEEARQVLEKMKDRISQTMEKPTEVYADEIKLVPPHVLPLLPHRQKVLAILKRRKRWMVEKKEREQKMGLESSNLAASEEDDYYEQTGNQIENNKEQLPQIQQIQQIPQVPQIPQIPQIPQLPQLPQLPQIPQPTPSDILNLIDISTSTV